MNVSRLFIVLLTVLVFLVVPSDAQNCPSTGCKYGKQCVKNRCKWVDVCGIRSCSRLGAEEACMYLKRNPRRRPQPVKTTCGAWAGLAVSRRRYRNLRRNCPRRRRCRRGSRIYDEKDRPYCSYCQYKSVSYLSGFRQYGSLYGRPSCVRSYGRSRKYRCFRKGRNKCFCRHRRRRRGGRRETFRRSRLICEKINPLCRRRGRRFCVCPLRAKKLLPSASPSPDPVNTRLLPSPVSRPFFW